MVRYFYVSSKRKPSKAHLFLTPLSLSLQRAWAVKPWKSLEKFFEVIQSSVWGSCWWWWWTLLRFFNERFYWMKEERVRSQKCVSLSRIPLRLSKLIFSLLIPCKISLSLSVYINIYYIYMCVWYNVTGFLPIFNCLGFSCKFFGFSFLL